MLGQRVDDCSDEIKEMKRNVNSRLIGVESSLDELKQLMRSLLVSQGNGVVGISHSNTQPVFEHLSPRDMIAGAQVSPLTAGSPDATQPLFEPRDSHDGRMEA